MRTWKPGAVVIAAAALVLATPVISSPAAALPATIATASVVRTADHPAVPQPKVAQPKVTIPEVAHPEVAGINNLLNSDIVLQVNESSGPVQVAEGHLALTRYQGSTFHGTFTDNLGGGAVYPASAAFVSTTTDVGVFSIVTHVGAFRLNYSLLSHVVTAPTIFGVGSHAQVNYTVHRYTRQYPIGITVASRFGAWLPSMAGTLTLTTDALRYIVPNNTKTHIAGTFIYTVAPSATRHLSLVTSSGQYTPPNCANGGVLRLAMPQYKSAWQVAATEFDAAPGGGCPMIAQVYNGNGSGYSQSAFVARLVAQ
jgi:hypothetical protein